MQRNAIVMIDLLVLGEGLEGLEGFEGLENWKI
jgi:hypothetical protein